MLHYPARHPLPETYTRGGFECVLDRSRGFLVKATKEERVRQQTVSWLVEDIGVPFDLIRTEFNHRRHGGVGRSDILALHPDEERSVLVVECKRPGLFLDERTRAQVARYAAQVQAQFCIVTNGTDVTALAQSEGSWRALENVPTWQEMLEGRLTNWRAEEEYSRWHWDDYGRREQMLQRLQDSRDILAGIVGEDSAWFIAAFACNLYDLFVYGGSALTLPIEDDRIVVKQDLGVHDRTFGNAAGGQWASDAYRSFLVFDKQGNTHQVVSLLICSSMKTHGDQVYGNRKGRTYLVAAIDDGPRSHLSLEACLDLTIAEPDVSRGEVTVTHNGALTAGRSGAVARREVLAFVAARAPHLINGGQVHLGSIACGRLILWPDVSDFLVRTIRYALIRDEFRASRA